MIAGLIVTYNPEIDIFEQNFQSIVNQVDKLLIVDNSSENIDAIKKVILPFNSVEVIKNKENLGIANALNQGIKWADKNKIKWLLTLDQDSMCDENLINEYSHYIGYEAVIILAPSILDINLNEKKEIVCNSQETSEIEFAITSGSLINIERTKDIDGFDSKLFIDYVDFDFCIKARENGYRILKINKAYLYHRLGDSVTKKILNFEWIITNHSALRRYYLYRNKMILYKRYWKTQKKWLIQDVASSLKTVTAIILFEKNKLDKVKAIKKGIMEGFKSKWE